MAFYDAPARELTEADLRPVPYYIEKGNNAEEAPQIFYWMYKLQKQYVTGEVQTPAPTFDKFEE